MDFCDINVIKDAGSENLEKTSSTVKLCCCCCHRKHHQQIRLSLYEQHQLSIAVKKLQAHLLGDQNANLKHDPWKNSNINDNLLLLLKN